ncbi:MAG TPA: 16S rRNA (cytosine(1402)-N(4))-methyltransferase RsmH [Smithellaceae bacterium]|nr:16S rRNA (cytosine(1402)-N(4))-methyltransferase RsmH [Smithellaceae bacterium]HRS89585.1 16S rRNA (cytosine(1402)-N(4))-methyltransferase RsmH [Smithellaceae bacterium]HRV26354.1 16S rRNA (cytosine(1402)-N(4))-methyltransferase RsmH [Smithellaceae bacterium]
MKDDFFHEPVMVKEVIEMLWADKKGVYVDATVGGGGHAQAILENTEGFLVGIDRDEEALAFAEKKLARFGQRKVLVNANYSEIGEVLKNLGIEKVDGVLFDLGVSSRQLDKPERGFSFSAEARLDMRMDGRAKLTASDIINKYGQEELAQIIKSYGEEKMAARIARAIVTKRKSAPIETTTQLAAIVTGAIPVKFRSRKIHPATKTFQAIRIAVNNEIEEIKPALQAATDALKPGGRMCVISFHSLEDRVVKNEFRLLAGGCTCPKDIPFCVCGRQAKLKLITAKAQKPSAEEVQANPRARSARLRAAERC